MSHTTIVFAITNNMLFAVANVIIGVEKYNPGVFNYLIFVEEKNKLDRRELTALYNIVNESQFLLNGRVVVRNVRDLKVENLINYEREGIKSFINRWTYMPLVKVCMYRLFDIEFSKSLGLNEIPSEVLWLDCDILVQGNIEKILNYGKICATLGSFAKPLLKGVEYFNYIDDSDIKPNGGVVLYKKDLFENSDISKIDQDVRDILSVLADNKILGLEEHLITALCKKNNWHLDIISDEYNYLPGYSYHSMPRIVHSLGKNKFWNNVLVNLIFPEWEINNKQWLKYLLIAGVDSAELSRFNRSVRKSSSMREILFSSDWQSKWDGILNSIKFSHANCYQQVTFRGNWCKFFLKNENISQDCHYELISKGTKFVVALHFENSYQNKNNKLVSYLQSLEKFKYKFYRDDNILSLQVEVPEINVGRELERLISVTFPEIVKIIG